MGYYSKGRTKIKSFAGRCLEQKVFMACEVSQSPKDWYCMPCMLPEWGGTAMKVDGGELRRNGEEGGGD